jgi:hypothetical protein
VSRRSACTQVRFGHKLRDYPSHWLAALATTLLLAPAFAPSAAFAWGPKTQIAIAERAAIIAPPDLRRQIAKNQAEFRAGVLAPFEGTPAAAHEKNEDGSGLLDREIAEGVDGAIDAIRAHHPFSEIVEQLGVLTHYAADASNPLNVSSADPEEEKYSADYLRYLDSAWPRFRVVFYGAGRDLSTPADISSMLERSFSRGRLLYPSLHAEYQRIGAPRGVALFDDRSTAFGVGSVAFSHAVSDAAALLRYIWLRAGGVDNRHLPITHEAAVAATTPARP